MSFALAPWYGTWKEAFELISDSAERVQRGGALVEQAAAAAATLASEARALTESVMVFKLGATGLTGRAAAQGAGVPRLARAR